MNQGPQVFLTKSSAVKIVGSLQTHTPLPWRSISRLPRRRTPWRSWWTGRTYLDFVCELELPSPAQSDAFAKFSTNAHSWYKHLPLFPPGARFVFFLDPNAGLVQEWNREGPFGGRWKRRLRPRTKELCEHYSHMTTERYRELFGAWGYAVIHVYPLPSPEALCEPITRLRRRITSYLQTWQDGLPPGNDYVDPRYRRFPYEILEQCGCQVTGFVHSDGELFPQLLENMIFHPEDEPTNLAFNRFQTYAASHPDDVDVCRDLPLAEFLVECRRRYPPSELFVEHGKSNAAMKQIVEVHRRLRSEAETFAAAFHQQERRILLERVKTTLCETRAFFARLRDIPKA